jgi:N6-adenosine-specific RNA methylase IME4
VNASEFVIFARRGTLPALRRVDRTWFEWPRPYITGGGPTHSAKPEAFLDMVEQVSPEPRVELFARRDRLGWQTWGDQSLGTATMPGEGEAA